VPGIGCGSPRPIGYTHATELLNDGRPFHVVQRYLGHQSPKMTARYANLAATAEAELLKPSTPAVFNQTRVARRSNLA
jgi:integrase